MAGGLWVERSGPATGVPLVLLHGLGATAETFRPLVDAAAPGGWDGPCVAVDLPGHGRSAWSGGYQLDDLAEAVRAAVPELAEAVVLGHSLGGFVAIALATGSGGREPRGAVAFSVKSAWSQDDRARASAVASKPRGRFETQEQAEERFLRIAGLAGVADWPALRSSGVVEDAGTWVLRQDPATNGFVAPDMTQLLSAARCPVRLATGEHDLMAPPAMLAEVAPDGVVVPGAGHPLHVEAPAAVLALAHAVLPP